MPGTATYIVYKVGNACRVWNTATNSDLAGVGTTPEAALQKALDLVDPADPASGGVGDVYVAAGDYQLTLPAAQFSGFNLHSYTTLKLNTKARIIVRQGYAAAVFNLLSDDDEFRFGVVNSMIDGGRITELGRPANPQWTAFRLKGSSTGAVLGDPSSTAGMQFNKIANTEVQFAKIGLEIVVDQLKGYVNSNTFEFLRMLNCTTFVSFEMADLPYTTGNPIFANRFADLQLNCQSHARTQMGIRNVTGELNEFDSVKVWDINQGVAAPGQTDPLTIQVSARAANTIIVGGLLVGANVKSRNFKIESGTTKVLPPP
ncbi:hypothetical protein [Geodermatophilus sabuli]|uniref:Pectate lyase superfamily protein n=1 Tax=Geodermatophilus sabuli TaxID=1564158 RepID=A0A285E6D3_9ACTN|nr:hypothetical protein [Geodermatophilus sabuli]MBB3082462.1 hypothetical protein [Geodermatophilus sabuli]SNX94668.1 hypothetical protein SAMN06893097_101465 [Geodermatophilus sabuli]